MTRVLFYSEIVDTANAVAILVQKALMKKHQVTIMVADEKAAKHGSEMLWQDGSMSFLPNVLASNALAKTTPIVFDWNENQLCQDDILINLSHRQLTAFSRFRQLIEVVGVEESDKVEARQRYKFYRDRGYEIKHFNQESLIHS